MGTEETSESQGYSFLAPDAIPEEIIPAGAEHLGPLLH
jgi:hypothetical protein